MRPGTDFDGRLPLNPGRVVEWHAHLSVLPGPAVNTHLDRFDPVLRRPGYPGNYEGRLDDTARPGCIDPALSLDRIRSVVSSISSSHLVADT